VTVDQLYDMLLSDYKINGKCLWWAQQNWDKHLKPVFGGSSPNTSARMRCLGISNCGEKRRLRTVRSIGN
jgi:hypothetical protein